MRGDAEVWARDRLLRHLRESAAVAQQVQDACAARILDAVGLLTASFRTGGTLLLCGNGGSAADCQHVAAELVSRLSADFVRPALPAVALTTDSSFLTAFANDHGFDDVFARQVQALGRPGDVLLGISTSGASINVVRAVAAAQAVGMRTLTLTGQGGRLREMADVAIAVPSTHTQYIQEAHLVIEHVLCDLVERTLFGVPERGA